MQSLKSNIEFKFLSFIFGKTTSKVEDDFSFATFSPFFFIRIASWFNIINRFLLHTKNQDLRIIKLPEFLISFFLHQFYQPLSTRSPRFHTMDIPRKLRRTRCVPDVQATHSLGGNPPISPQGLLLCHSQTPLWVNFSIRATKWNDFITNDPNIVILLIKHYVTHPI